MNEEVRRGWEIRIIREAIDRDWASLASNTLDGQHSLNDIERR
jgi:hypothetical protein